MGKRAGKRKRDRPFSQDVARYFHSIQEKISYFTNQDSYENLKLDGKFIQFDVQVHVRNGTDPKLGILLKVPVLNSSILNSITNDIPRPVVQFIDQQCEYKNAVGVGDILVAVDGKDVCRLLEKPEKITEMLMIRPVKLTFIRKDEGKRDNNAKLKKVKQSLDGNNSNFTKFDVQVHTRKGSGSELGILLKVPVLNSSILNSITNDIPHPVVQFIDQKCEFKNAVNVGDILVAVDGKDVCQLQNLSTKILEMLKEGLVKLTFIRKYRMDSDNHTNEDEFIENKNQNLRNDDIFPANKVGTSTISTSMAFHDLFAIVFDVFLPPGKLGMTLSTDKSGITVKIIDNRSILLGLGVECMDQVLAIDDVHVDKNMNVPSLLNEKSMNEVRKVTFGKRLLRQKVYCFETRNVSGIIGSYKFYDLFLPPGRIGIDISCTDKCVWISEVLSQSALRTMVEKGDLIIAVDCIPWQQINILAYLRQKMFAPKRKLTIAKPIFSNRNNSVHKSCFCNCPSGLCDDQCECRFKSSFCSAKCSCHDRVGIPIISICRNSQPLHVQNIKESKKDKVPLNMISEIDDIKFVESDDDELSITSLPTILPQEQVKQGQQLLTTSEETFLIENRNSDVRQNPLPSLQQLHSKLDTKHTKQKHIPLEEVMHDISSGKVEFMKAQRPASYPAMQQVNEKHCKVTKRSPRKRQSHESKRIGSSLSYRFIAAND